MVILIAEHLQDDLLTPTSLLSIPKLVEEWDYELNAKQPGDYSCGSHEKVYWRCSLGHSWPAVIKNRTKLKRGCPYCSNQKVLAGFNDFASANPELLCEWDYSKNDVQPTEVLPHTAKKVYWICSKGHSWQASLNDRTGSKKNGCPYCSNKKVLGAVAVCFCLGTKKIPLLVKSWLEL